MIWSKMPELFQFLIEIFELLQHGKRVPAAWAQWPRLPARGYNSAFKRQRRLLR